MRILCPSDGSPRAAAAIDKLIASLDAGAITVDLLAVVADRRPPPAGASPRLSERRRGGEALLADHRARLAAAGFKVDVSLRSGHPAEEIVAHAEATGPDLVILGSRSADGDGHGYSGRVAGSVARHCHVPVLIARDGARIASIVLGYDESPDADTALMLVSAIPFRTPPRVTVCSVYEMGDVLIPGAVDAAHDDAHRAASREDLAELHHAAQVIAADAAARLHAAGIAATGQALHGRASGQLEITAAELGADLIMVGSRGLSGVERFLLGSTSDELVVASRTSLLIVRS